jgi:hypothetical protein
MARARVGGRSLPVAAALSAALLGGCAARSGSPALTPEAAREIGESYRASAPVRMQAVQSVVMSWRHRPLTALGWLRYDREPCSFALVGLSPTGATLFSLSEAGGEAAGSFAAPPGGDPKAWIAAMADDVRRIYCDGIPRPDDEVRAVSGAAALVRRLSDGGELRLRLAQAPLRCEAEWRRGGRRIGTTLYEDYEEHGALRVPRRIVHRNLVYGYELVIRTKEIQSLEPTRGSVSGEAPRP